MRALLVDDDPGSRFLLRCALLKWFSATTREVGDGKQALREIENGTFDAVFLDLHMPIMGGMETLRAVRASATHAGLPIIILTSESDGECVREAIGLGVADYLVKPLTSEQVRSRVARVLTQAAHAGARRA